MSEYIPKFKDSEFACQCCGQGGLQPHTRDKFEAARIISGVPYVVTSGFRCEKNQARLVQEGKSEPTSSHPKGEAGDIKATGLRDRERILWGLMQAGFTRIGIGKTFIHADDDPDKPEEVIWLYEY